MATIAPPKPSMNEAHEQDPYNNSCYGSLVDAPYKLADLSLARSLVPAGTATLRDFSNIAPEIPVYLPENCTGCMDCVTECPDTAILGKVLSEAELEAKLATIADPDDREMYRADWSRTKKYYDASKKKGLAGGV